MFQREVTDWCKYFDRIFLVNLKSRKDRLKHAVREMRKFNIPFMRWEATYDDNGAAGLYSTMIGLLHYCKVNNIKRFLVFEDDVHFLKSPNQTMESVTQTVPKDWDLIYLGCNLPNSFNVSQRQSYFRINYAFATHAVCYSESAVDKILKTPVELPFDSMLVNRIQPLEKSFCTYPMLVTQLPGWSDIEKKVVTHYNTLLEDRFNQNVKVLL